MKNCEIYWSRHETITELSSKSNISRFLSLFVLLTAFTCEDEPLDDGLAGQAESNLTCANSTLALITATENYGNANEGDVNFTTICNTYKTALQNQIIACGDPNGVLQITVNSLGNCM